MKILVFNINTISNQILKSMNCRALYKVLTRTSNEVDLYNFS